MTRAKAENTVTYKRRIGKVGAYGEHKVVTWDSANGVALARIYENNDGTVEVTLYSADNKPHPRTLPNDGQRCWNICEAHVKERGFTTMIRETSDVRAYND
jgi:hypothetical protein